jgi:hypothetical protein
VIQRGRLLSGIDNCVGCVVFWHTFIGA